MADLKSFMCMSLYVLSYTNEVHSHYDLIIWDGGFIQLFAHSFADMIRKLNNT